MSKLHEKLIEKQSIEELKRKADIASRKHLWSVEEIDLAKRKAKEVAKKLHWGNGF